MIVQCVELTLRIMLQAKQDVSSGIAHRFTDFTHENNRLKFVTVLLAKLGI